MMANNQTGKARKAHNRLDAINEEIKEIKKQRGYPLSASCRVIGFVPISSFH